MLDDQEAREQPGPRDMGENGSEGDEEARKLNAQVCGVFKLIMEDIGRDEKIHSYLLEIEVTPEELLGSYRSIVSSNEELAAKTGSNWIVRQSAVSYFEFLLAFLRTKSAGELDSKGRAVWYLEIETKLHCCLEFFHNFKRERDITNSPRQDFTAVWARIRVEQAGDVKRIRKDYKAMKRMLHVATSASINESAHHFSLAGNISFGLSFPKYLIMNDSAKLRSFLFYRKPTLEMAQKIWNLPEQGATREISKITFEGIKTNLKIYIPADGTFHKDLDIFEQRPGTITVRVLYHKKLKKYPEFGQTGCCESEKEGSYIDRAVLHIHGGGFVALSSRSMQNHTRKWANELGVPILSVDYRMPPNHPFPQAPLDCLTAYRFVLQHLHHYLNIRPAALYLAGDSAGGCLVCALTGLVLRERLPLPRALYLSYPATDLRYTFSTSRLYAITDPLLWPSMLLVCLNSYLNGDLAKADDPLASPVLLTEEYVGGAAGDQRFPLKWPKTLVTVGNRDPLYDDSLMLMQRMVGSGIDCECIVYDELSHGYLSTELFIRQSAKTLRYSVEHLRRLIGLA